MKLKNILLLLTFILLNFLEVYSAEIRYSGGDISLLPTYQAKGSRYYDLNGKQVDFITYSAETGMNAMRVRLFVDPDNFNATYSKMYDANVCQDLEYILPLCKQIKGAGLKLMLDFHYSDTWADPVKQYTPEAWKSLTDTELITKIYDYTQSVLLTLKENGAEPDFIQTGNEISYGMLWGPYGASSSVINPNKVNSSETTDASWNRLANLLKSAIKACREECPKAEIIIHTERIANTNLMITFYNKMKSLDVDYDIIGISYYPYFHGPLSYLESALNLLERNYPDKSIMLVEAGYPLYWKQDEAKNSFELEYPLDAKTDNAQSQFTKDLVDLLLKHENVNGLFWWWMEYNPYWSNLENWYNAPLVDPRTGRVTSAFATLASFATPDENNNGDTGKDDENQGGGDNKDDKVDNGDDKPGTDVVQPGENPDDKKDPDIDQPSNPSDDKKDPAEEDNTDSKPEDKPNDNNPSEEQKPTETPSTPDGTDNPGNDGDNIETPDVVNPDDKEDNKEENDTPSTPEVPDVPQTPNEDNNDNIEIAPDGGESDNDSTDPSENPSQGDKEPLPDQSEDQDSTEPGDSPEDVLPENPEDAGVEGILMDESTIKYYDINGHEVKYPTKPGIYISNGKKFVVR